MENINVFFEIEIEITLGFAALTGAAVVTLAINFVFPNFMMIMNYLLGGGRGWIYFERGIYFF